MICLLPGVEAVEPDDPMLEGTSLIKFTAGPDGGEGGYANGLEAAIESTYPADLVFLFEGTKLPPGWMDSLRSACMADGTIAAAGVISGSPWFLSATARSDVHSLRGRHIDVSRKLRPRVPMLDGPCLMFKRPALELVGHLRSGLRSPLGQLIDLSQQCLLSGMSLVVADDVFAPCPYPGLPLEDESELKKRFEHLPTLLSLRDSDPGPLGVALDIASRFLDERKFHSLTVDGSCFVDDVAGTQVHVLELLAALSRSGAVRLRVLLLRGCPAWARERIAELPGVETLIWEELDESTPKTDLVHRPWQVGHPTDLKVLRQAGKRLVVTQQDLINQRNPAFFPRPSDWMRFRSMVRWSLDAASHVIFFSDHARKEALAEGLVDVARTSVVHIGSQRSASPESPTRPSWYRAEGPFLLCLGNDFLHKNRRFALAVMDELLNRYGWEGHLIMAGPKTSRASSSQIDVEFLRVHPSTAGATIIKGSVTEAEKAWLMKEAAGVLFPSVVEGFGLVPFEAAAAGTPPIFASQSAMQELIPSELALIAPWDAEATAEAVHRLITDAEYAGNLSRQIDSIGKSLDWDKTAIGLLRAYEQAMASDLRPTFRSLPPGLMDLDLPPHVALAMSGLASHPKLAWPIFWVLGRLYPLARRVYKILVRIKQWRLLR